MTYIKITKFVIDIMDKTSRKQKCSKGYRKSRKIQKERKKMFKKSIIQEKYINQKVVDPQNM